MNMRKLPITIEFTGLPNSGKTTLIHNLKTKLELDGLKVKIMQEDAEIAPKQIPKGTFIRNLWITLGQLQSLLEVPYLKEDYDIILIDRGYFDALFWANFLYDRKVASDGETDLLLTILDEMEKQFNLLPNHLFVIDVSVDESIKRRSNSSEKPVLSKNDFLLDYKNISYEFYNTIVDVPYSYLDTTNMNTTEVLNDVYQKIMNLIA